MRCAVREPKPLKPGRDGKVYVNVALDPDDADTIQQAAHGMTVTGFVRYAALHHASVVVQMDREFRKSRGG